MAPTDTKKMKREAEKEIEAMRERAKARGDKPRYDGTCRERGLPPGPDAVVRFKAPLTGTTVVPDKVKGSIVFQNSELDDFIIRRSDGTPTYNFVVVVDDITLGINTIIRGAIPKILLTPVLKCSIDGHM